MIADKPRITKQVTDMYIKRIRFVVDMHRIYIKPHGIKNVDYHIGTYHMDPEDIDEIIKDKPEKWKSFTVDLSNSDEELPKEKDKGKEKRRRRSAQVRSVRLRKKADRCIKGQSSNHTSRLQMAS